MITLTYMLLSLAPALVALVALLVAALLVARTHGATHARMVAAYEAADVWTHAPTDDWALALEVELEWLALAATPQPSPPKATPPRPSRAPRRGIRKLERGMRVIAQPRHIAPCVPRNGRASELSARTVPPGPRSGAPGASPPVGG